MKKIMLLSFLFLSVFGFGQKENLIKYLDAYKTSEFDESKKIISDYSFGGSAIYTLLEYNDPIGILFDTDMPGIKGYKAIVVCKMKAEAGNNIEKKMLVIMYLNKRNNLWSVCDFRESCNPNDEYLTAKNDIDNGKFYTDKQYVYRNLAYWALNAGKIKDTIEAINKAKIEAENSKDSNFTISDTELTINSIQ